MKANRIQKASKKWPSNHIAKGMRSLIGTLILSHGRLAEELLAAGLKIYGTRPSGLTALALDWDEDLDAARQRLESAVESLDSGAGVLVLADVPGGTPYNLALELAERHRLEGGSGVNLPMVLRLICQPRAEIALGELAAFLAGKGQDSIKVAQVGALVGAPTLRGQPARAAQPGPADLAVSR